MNNFKPENHFKTSKELVENKMLDVSPHSLTKNITFEADHASLKYKYNRLAEYMER